MPEINLGSVLDGALASMVVGMLWYGLLFGKVVLGRLTSCEGNGRLAYLKLRAKL